MKSISPLFLSYFCRRFSLFRLYSTHFCFFCNKKAHNRIVSFLLSLILASFSGSFGLLFLSYGRLFIKFLLS
jgi:hypothetical protein